MQDKSSDKSNSAGFVQWSKPQNNSTVAGSWYKSESLKMIVQSQHQLFSGHSEWRPPLCLFETHPDAQKLFPKFAGLSKEQLENNPDFQAHGEIAVSTLTEFVQHQKADQSFVKELAQRREVWFQKMNFSIFSEIIVMVAAEKIDGFGTDAQTALKNVLKAFQTAMGA
ncbi:MYG protein, partial [Polypterus senegalus]